MPFFWRLVLYAWSPPSPLTVSHSAPVSYPLPLIDCVPPPTHTHPGMKLTLSYKSSLSTLSSSIRALLEAGSPVSKYWRSLSSLFFNPESQGTHWSHGRIKHHSFWSIPSHYDKCHAYIITCLEYWESIPWRKSILFQFRFLRCHPFPLVLYIL